MKEAIKENAGEIFEHYLGELTGYGRQRKATCPFHDDQAPSLQVNTEDWLFYCHPCGKGGDVFSLIMEMEGCDFKDALRTAADILDVEYKATGVNSLETGILKAKRAWGKSLESEKQRILANLDWMHRFAFKAGRDDICQELMGDIELLDGARTPEAIQQAFYEVGS